MEGILTGDIVSSTRVKPGQREVLYRNVGEFLATIQTEFITNYETFRGDSFQCKATYPHLALKVAVLIRAFFRAYTTGGEVEEGKKTSKGYFTTKYDVRIGIGLGEIEFMNENKITSSDGPAFRFSGEGLDQLKNQSQRLILKSSVAEIDEQFEPSILLLDAIIQKWTQNQAVYVLYKLQNMKEDEIADKLKITQSAVTQRKKTAQWHAIEKLLNYFEKTIKKLEN